MFGNVYEAIKVSCGTFITVNFEHKSILCDKYTTLLVENTMFNNINNLT